MGWISIAPGGEVRVDGKFDKLDFHGLKFNRSALANPALETKVGLAREEEARSLREDGVWPPAQLGDLRCEVDGPLIEMLSEARHYITQRYSSLGLAPPKSALQGVIAKINAEIVCGDASALSRSFRVAISPNSPRDLIVSLIVHEQSHALAPVTISEEHGTRHEWHSLWSTGAAMSRIGAKLRLPGCETRPRRVLFSVLEEGAAMSHQYAYLESRGLSEAVGFTPFLLTQDLKLDARLKQAILLQYCPKEYETISRSVVNDDWETAINRFLSSKAQGIEIRIPSVVMSSNDSESHLTTAYTQMFYALNLLAKELYSECEARVAVSKFRDELCRVQAGSSYAPLMKTMTKAFGLDAVRFISRLEIGASDEVVRSIPEDELALLVFAQAGNSPPEIKEKVRRLVIDSVLHRPTADLIGSLTPILEHIESSAPKSREIYIDVSAERMPFLRQQVMYAVSQLCRTGQFDLAVRFLEAFGIPKGSLRSTSQQLLDSSGVVSVGNDTRTLLPEWQAARHLAKIFSSMKPLTAELPKLPKGFQESTALKALATQYLASLSMSGDPQDFIRTMNILRRAGVPVNELAPKNNTATPGTNRNTRPGGRKK